MEGVQRLPKRALPGDMHLSSLQAQPLRKTTEAQPFRAKMWVTFFSFQQDMKPLILWHQLAFLMFFTFLFLLSKII